METLFQLPSQARSERILKRTPNERFHFYGSGMEDNVCVRSPLETCSSGFPGELVLFFIATLQLYVFLLKQFQIHLKMVDCCKRTTNFVLFPQRIGARRRTILPNGQ